MQEVEVNALSESKFHKADYDRDTVGPLNGIRVLDLSRLFAGNALTQMLGDFGAEVIKVEPKEGDTLRAWQTQGIETNWKLYARNKKSLALNLRHEYAQKLLRHLVETCHVLVESFRPGTLEKMGLAPEQLHRRHPKLVIVRISGWGQEGPYSHRPGFGTLIEGISGFASFNGFPDREPVLPPFYMADAFAGSYGATATMIALRNSEKLGGIGQVIDVSLLDPLFHVLGPQAANYRLTGTVKPRVGSRSTNSGPRNAYRTKDDRYVSLSASTQKMAERLFRSIGREDLINNPKFATNAARVKNVDELDNIVADFISQRTQAENVAFFEAAEVTIGPIYDISQIIEDPHFIERGIIREYPDNEMGSFPMHTVLPRLSATPGSIRTPAPALGAHNREVLAKVGIDEHAYRKLLESGIVFEAST
ncbi:CoA transferase [Allopusillimonas soli]|uniref:CoA transferase n=1 Tax=Allopusillimonas soli TaxID=659016 RepID=A0A853FDM2_9BURK|nr:CoA transferase [Allopusillimonas soli]NYT38173.1 CoA transferase [Allopusillimonas soli]TEA74045.1 CoA transferase [Allopusillimonas soli]